MKSIAVAVLAAVLTQTAWADTFSIAYSDGKVVRSFPDRTRPVVGLALSGGSARGLAHLGVIDILEKNGIHIERIAGTSMGSIVGGLYAAGYSVDYLIDQFGKTDWTDAMSSSPRRRKTHVGMKDIHDWPLFELRFDKLRAQIPSSLSSGQHFTVLLTWLCFGPTFTSGGDFDRLPIPFRSVATDLVTGERVVLGRGNLARAIQASSTVPLLFTPVKMGDRYLVDGGLVDHLPVSVTRDMGSDFVIASVVEESMRGESELNNFVEIADQVTSIPTRKTTYLSRQNADAAIVPDMEHFSSADFDALPKALEKGRIAALAAIPALRDSLQRMTDTYRRALIDSISITPGSENTFARPIIAANFASGDTTLYADIAEALENLWMSGRYSEIRATLDERSRSLDVALLPVPTKVTLSIPGLGDIDHPTETSVISNEFNVPLTMQEIIGEIDAGVRMIQSEKRSLATITATEFNSTHSALSVTVDIPRLTEIILDPDLSLRPSILLREMDVRVGEPFDLNGVVSSLENLYGTNFFEWVYADMEYQDGGVRLLIHVKEKKLMVARFGLRYDETYNSKARATLSRESLFGIGNQFSFVAEASSRNRLLIAESRSSRIYKSLYTYSIKAYRNYRLRYLYSSHTSSEDYGDDRYGALISIGQHMDKLGSVMLQFKTESIWITTGPKEKLESTKKEFRSIILRSLIDSYDRYPFPQNGLTNLMYIETTMEAFGGTDQYVKLFWSGSMYRTLAKKHTLSGSFALGSADPSTPDIEMFTLGGSPLRLNCYDWESTGSHFFADFPGLACEERYGNRLATASVAYRLFIPRLFYLTFNYTAGNIWLKGETITAESLLHGFGVTGTLSTWGGPLSIGWGSTSKGNERIYMSAGWEF